MTAVPAESTPPATAASLGIADDQGTAAVLDLSGRYGPSALWTPANAITIGRIVLAPLLIWQILRAPTTWPTFWLGFVLAFSDNIDGRLARKHGTTRSGAFL